jgi:type II secretory pathway component PulF
MIESLQTIGLAMLAFVVFVTAGLGPIWGLLYLFYFLLTLPLRRNERARLFLDLLELGLKEGRTPELAIADAASSADRSLGARFHLLAAYLGQGLRLSQALEKTPRLLPPQLRMMLKTGERIGDISKVLPACRKFLQDGISQVRGAHNYLILVAFAITPVMIWIPLVFRLKVLPSFMQTFETILEGQPLPPFTRLVFGESYLLTFLQIGLVGFLWLLLLAYLGGPRLYGWLHSLLPSLPDTVLLWLPWRRKRLQRDFSAMLAVLLDAGVPEAEAVTLAAEATRNVAIRFRAERALARLNEGIKLPEAIRAMDDTGELRWRLANALQRGSGFLRALAGWHEALDAKAFQLEQGAAQIATSALVLFNGAIVAALIIAIFLAFIQLLNQAILW